MRPFDLHSPVARSSGVMGIASFWLVAPQKKSLNDDGDDDENAAAADGDEEGQVARAGRRADSASGVYTKVLSSKGGGLDDDIDGDGGSGDGSIVSQDRLPLLLHPLIPAWVRVAVLIAIIFNIALFVSSNTSTGASVFIKLVFGGKVCGVSTKTLSLIFTCRPELCFYT